MNVIVDFCLIPIGTSVSLSPYVAACEQVLTGPGLKTALHANGTNIEGEWGMLGPRARDRILRPSPSCLTGSPWLLMGSKPIWSV